ncbi:angiopoietin-related protein 3 [Denticeps clupeoides]|uniref:angiopoietin-related protein 3 n=1 Tax=Denticeps clupeoides TaxID=299321 RepID=UPI0010A57D57|nr:angiopoietin-related protein 3 [Denticeps clupeoides]
MKLIGLILLIGLSSTAALKTKLRSTTEAPPSIHPPAESKSRFAMLDDVRLLANGLLQLGQSLKDFVTKTKGQINDIFQKLNIFDHSFNQLSEVTNEIKEEERELKKTTNFLKTNNEEIRNLSLEINSKINSIMQERVQLHSQVGGLEEKLKGISESMMPVEQLKEITTLKDMIESQEKTITDLLKAVRGQNEQLNHQKSKIKSLEEKLVYDQETAEKNYAEVESPEIFHYLRTNGSINPTSFPVDCSDAFNQGQRESGVYPIKPNQSEPFNVFCEMTSDGGAVVIQRREDGSVDFDQEWDKYEKGFGNLEKEFWLGLEKIYSIANQGEHIMHLELEDWRHEKRFIEYLFKLDGPSSKYSLHLSHLTGNLPDAMSNHTATKFSTKDQDNDKHEESNCARIYSGGWWFDACGESNLNGKYLWQKSRGRNMKKKGIYWKPGRGGSYSLKFTKITIRPSPHFH